MIKDMEDEYKNIKDLKVKTGLVFSKTIIDRFKSNIWNLVADLIIKFWEYWKHHSWRFVLGKPHSVYNIQSLLLKKMEI